MTVPALFLQRYTNGYQEALLTNQAVILIKTHKKPPGRMYEVKIEGIRREILIGSLA